MGNVAANSRRRYGGRIRVFEAAGTSIRPPRDGGDRDRESDTRQQLGGRSGIHVEEAVTVTEPASVLFRFWRNFENLPTFMTR